MKYRMAALSGLLATCLLAIVCAGCGRRERVQFVPMSGKVTRGNQPLAKGRITFYPTGATKGPISGAEISGGNYKIETHGGVPAGIHRVAIHELGPDPKSPGTETNLLPPKFNDTSKLEIEVTKGAKSMTKDFDLDKDFNVDSGEGNRRNR